MTDATSGCVLFADVSGSTDFCDTVGATAGHQAIELCVKLCTALTEQHGGRVVKAHDDEVMAIFPDAAAAGEAARDIQLGVHDISPVEKVRLGVRIGMHFGPVDERDGDLFGETVNLAARLTEMAARDQIVASTQTVDLLTPMQKMGCRKLFSVPMKGWKDGVDVCELMWSDSEDATELAVQRVSTDAGESLRLVHRTRVVTLAAGGAPVVVGRDMTAGLVVADRKASRAHCEIASRNGAFVLADRSQNGTYLSIDGERELVLRGEEAVLRGHGFITLGQSRSTATEFVEFFCS
ncbi:MAG: adenylate/guanylate cyclase domain-containing protein [Usitatibacter sp.]